MLTNVYLYTDVNGRVFPGKPLPAIDGTAEAKTVRFEDIAYLTEACRERMHWAEPVYQDSFNQTKIIFDYPSRAQSYVPTRDVISEISNAAANRFAINNGYYGAIPSSWNTPNTIRWPIVSELGGVSAWDQVLSSMHTYGRVTPPQVSRVLEMDSLRYSYYNLERINRFILKCKGPAWGWKWSDAKSWQQQRVGGIMRWNDYACLGPLVENDGDTTYIRRSGESPEIQTGIHPLFYEQDSNLGISYSDTNVVFAIHPGYYLNPITSSPYYSSNLRAYALGFWESNRESGGDRTGNFVTPIGVSLTSTSESRLVCEALYRATTDRSFLMPIWSLVREWVDANVDDANTSRYFKISLDDFLIDTGEITNLRSEISSTNWNWHPPVVPN